MKRFLHSLRFAVLAGLLVIIPAVAYAQIPHTALHNIPAPLGASHTNDNFGWAVAINGTRLVVGVRLDDAGATDSGSVYVYDLSSGSATVPVLTLNNPTPATSDWFGTSVALSGNRLVVGAHNDDTGATDAGSVYVYDLSSSTPTVPVFTINNPAPAVGDNFGYAVSIDGTRLVIGAYQDDAGANNAGSAYVYNLNSGTPTVPVATMNNPAPGSGDWFGAAVSISGTKVVIGAPFDGGVMAFAGIAYVYDMNSGTPSVPVVTLNNPHPAINDTFGCSVAISGTRVVVGAYGDDFTANNEGTAYVYDLSSATPAVPVITLLNPSPAVSDQFGNTVAISGTRAVIGAVLDDAGATNSGTAYVYELSSETPAVPVATLNNPSPASGDLFSASISIDGTTIAMGSPYDDSVATDAGYVYVFGPADTITLPPTLTTPAANAFINNTVNVAFSLPEAALPGSVTLTFEGALQTQVLTLAGSQEAAGAHSFSFDVGAPAAAAEVESGLPLEYDGAYTVTLSYRDALGNAAATAVAANVTLDTQPPVVGGVFSPLLIAEGALPDYRSQATGDAVSYTQSPAPGTLVSPTPAGSVPVTVFGTDAAGNVGMVHFYVRVVPANPVHTEFAAKGAAVPGAGVEGSGIPAGAVWNSFGVPSVNDAGEVAVSATYKLAGKIMAGTFTGGPGSISLRPVAMKGDAAPGIANAVMSAMKDPLLGPDGSVAWVATLANAPGTTGAVTSADNAAIFLDADGAGPGSAVLVAREGAEAAGAAIWKSFGSVALGADAVFFTGVLETRTAGVSPGPGGATMLSDSGLWVYDRTTSTLALALREGDAMLGSTVKTINALVARPGSAGQGRGVESDGFADYTPVRVTLADARQAVAYVGQDGTVTTAYESGGDAPDYGTGAKWQRFGLPTQNSESTAMAFVGTVKAKTGTATTLNNVAIFAEDDEDYIAAKIVAKGDVAPSVTGGVFSALKDPVSAGNRAVAFIGALKTLPGVTAANNDGIWWNSPGGLSLVAREGAQPPEAPLGAQWKAFTSLALPEGHGPIFVAAMASKIGTTSPGPGGVTTADDLGLWATDSFGALRLLIREGDAIGASTVKSFTVLSSVPGSPAQTRSFNNTGAVVVRVTDTTGAQHLVQIAVP